MEEHPTPEAERTTAVVVHYGPWDTTRRTLESLRRHATGLAVRIVDNGGEAIPADVERLDGISVTILSASRNIGYAAACNLGARQAASDWLLFLNNDVELLDGTLEKMAAVLREHRDVGAVGPRLLDGEGRLRRSIGRAPSPRRVLFENLFLPRLLPGIPFFHGHHTAWISHQRPRLVETLLGAVLLVRRAAFEGVGGFCEDYFFYAEESDLFHRFRRLGWGVWFEPGARTIHHGGVASATVEEKERDRRLHAGLKLYARRFHGEKGERRVTRALRLGAALRYWLSFLEPGPRRSARRRRYANIRAMYRRGEMKASTTPPLG
jgi:N-acetylglucosaminyl-diphospho-decaprenol L-rhamnosyltransferase